MKSIKDYLAENNKLVLSTYRKVTSHVQRQDNQWFINTLLIDSSPIPFKYKRKKRYKSLVGARVDLIYYPTIEEVAGIPFEIMSVVKISRS